MAAKHLFVANEVGLFEQLADGPATLDALSSSTGPERLLFYVSFNQYASIEAKFSPPSDRKALSSGIHSRLAVSQPASFDSVFKTIKFGKGALESCPGTSTCTPLTICAQLLPGKYGN